MMLRSARCLQAACLLLPFAATALRAQCQNVWLPVGGLPGTNGEVRAVEAWDPDGAGPLPTTIVIGGTFGAAGNAVVNNIAAWDPASGSWSALGGGVDGDVYSVKAQPNGTLVVGGIFTQAGGVSANGIARWDGSTWSPLGGGMTGLVSATCTLANGDIVACGFFSSPTISIALWNGTSWSPMGSGLGGPLPMGRCLLEMPNGDVVVGGDFATAGGVAANGIARWNGSTWSTIGTFAGQSVASVALLANGDLLAAGAVPDRITRWDGASWVPLGPMLNAVPEFMTVLANGDVVASGGFTMAGSVAAERIARWDGAAWSAFAQGTSGTVRGLAELPNGGLMVGGNFQMAGIVASTNVALWDGANWSAPSAGVHVVGTVVTTTTLANGDLVAAGSFTNIGNVAANHIARWDGTTWSALGSGLVGFPGQSAVVYALAALANGDLVAAGKFASAGGVPTNNIARWDGTAWSPLGSGIGGPSVAPTVYALAILPNGDLAAAGSFGTAGGMTAKNVARWDGVSWSTLGASSPLLDSGSVSALAILPNGEVVAGTQPGSTPIARWDGVTWSPLGLPFNQHVHALAVQPNGDLVASVTATHPTFFHQVTRWDGTAWSTLGSLPNGQVNALAALPDGDVVAAGAFTAFGGAAANRIARWNGAAWSAFGTGCDGAVTELTVMPDGDLLVIGAFTAVDGMVSPKLARLTTTCPATVSSHGTGCGTNLLVASSLPWVDATLRTLGTGLPANSIVIAEFGFASIPQGAAPLAALLPGLGLPGCDALITPDILLLEFSPAGTVELDVFLPNTPPLVAVTFYHQMFPLEFDALGNWISIGATNALALTAGDF